MKKVIGILIIVWLVMTTLMIFLSLKLPARVAETDIVEEIPPVGVSRREVQETNGVRHTVPLNEIVGGGLPQDGIASIDDPQFISPEEASADLNDEELGVAIEAGDVRRFYPYQILVWHEIVNDTVDGKRMLISYCPLCLSGIVFDPVVDGERVEFGTSGKLWNSNLVMYDRKTESYWSQALGEAITGERAGDRLNILPSDQITFGDWKASLEGKSGEVLSRDTGVTRFYGDDPYGDYHTNNEAILSPVANRDDRLDAKKYILGIVIDNAAKAYLPEAVKREGEVVDTFEGHTFVLRYYEDLDVVRIFERLPDGTEERVNPLGQYWYSWSAIHPETQLYK